MKRYKFAHSRRMAGRNGRNGLIFALTVCLIAGIFTACAHDGAEQRERRENQNAAPYRYVIGVSMPTTQLVYRKAMRELLEADAGHPQAELRIYDAGGSQKQQNQDILEMADAGVDGIVLVPNTMESCLSSVEYANIKGIPVITVDNRIRSTSSAQVISFVGADHYSMGRDAAELFLRLLEEHYPEKETWNIIELTGIPDSSGTIDRGQAIADTLALNSRIRILGSFDGEFTVTNARSVMEDCLELFDTVDGVICQNDNMAEGCYQALKAVEKDGQTVVVGIDGQRSTLEIMAKGGIHGTVLQHPSMILDGIGYLCGYLDGKLLEDTYYEPTDIVNTDNAAYYLENDLTW